MQERVLCIRIVTTDDILTILGNAAGMLGIDVDLFPKAPTLSNSAKLAGASSAGSIAPRSRRLTT
jgi:hypothetical protein